MSTRVAGILATFTFCFGASVTPVLAGSALSTELVVSGLTRPVFVTHAPGDFGRIFVVEQPGRIKVVDLSSGIATVFLDIQSRVGSEFSEKGLLGLAFHPDYATNGFFYVNYTRPGDPSDTRISRFSVLGDPATSNAADPASEAILLAYLQPFSNHNGGWLAFGPNDGFLYIATGDGGNGGDPGDRAQTITNERMGKLLRIDVDGGFPFAIPPSNPFVNQPGDDEIWAYGLRNPWRNAFDRQTGDLYIADVGQNAWEEINFQAASNTGGTNWGWRCREGAHDFNFGGNCANETLVDPIHEYSHGGSPFRCSITGGEVYRGCAIPGLSGTYFFADFCSGQIWSFRGAGVIEFQERTAELEPPGPASIDSISSFGMDARGELYICDLSDGEVFKIVPVGGLFKDCNQNGIEDACDIASGASLDVDRNGIPDEVDCNDNNTCTAEVCNAGVCSNVPNSYGDVDHDGTINLFDLFCVLDGFSGDFSVCAATDTDIEPCLPNETINLFDLFAVLEAFNGVDPCCGGLP